MILTSFWQNPAVIGVIVALPSAALGYLGYRRSMKVDKVAEQAGIATSQTTSIGQVVDGLNKLVANLQVDNGLLRDEIATVRSTVELIRDRLSVVETGSTDLQAKNSELERENRVLHAENEASKVEIAAVRAESAAEIAKLKARIAELEKAKDHPDTL